MKENKKYTLDNLLSEIKNTNLKDLGNSIGSYINAFFIIPILSFLIMFIIVTIFEIWGLGKVLSYILAPIIILINFFSLSQYFIVEQKYSKIKARTVVGTTFLIVAFLFLITL